MKHLLATSLFILLFIANIFAQKNNVIIEGYVYAEDNSGYVKGAKVTLLTDEKTFRGEVLTDDLGKFEFIGRVGESYQLRVVKSGFNTEEMGFSTAGKAAGEHLYLNVEFKRAPGYIFEATIADWRPENSDEAVDAIEGATIEVYNKTTREVILELKDHPYHTFTFRMEHGNSYVILLRKKGYFNKRIDANISIDGCLLCIEGVGVTRSGIVDNLTDNNLTGTLGANIAMKEITMDEAVKVDNIYYDLGKYNIRQDAAYELDKIVSVLNDNPHISIELSSHTDSRGDAKANLVLSQKRAEAAAEYIVSQGIKKNRVTAKGYGEEELVNGCKDEVRCTETEHQDNRRTEFKVTSITSDETELVSLSEMMEKELFEENLEALMFQEVYVGDVKNTENEGVVYESYDNNVPLKTPTNGSKTSTNRTNLLSGSEEEYVSFEKPKVKSTGTKTEYTIKNDPFKNEPQQSVNQPINTAQKTTGTATKDAKPLHRTKKISTTYTGYKIELLVAKEVLTADHKLFREMGGVEIDVTEDGEYAYLIGNFSTESSATHFLNTVIKGRFPDARLQQYENGKRL